MSELFRSPAGTQLCWEVFRKQPKIDSKREREEKRKRGREEKRERGRERGVVERGVRAERDLGNREIRQDWILTKCTRSDSVVIYV